MQERGFDLVQEMIGTQCYKGYRLTFNKDLAATPPSKNSVKKQLKNLLMLQGSERLIERMEMMYEFYLEAIDKDGTSECSYECYQIKKAFQSLITQAKFEYDCRF